MVRRTRKMTMTMARPNPTSATVIAIVNSAKTTPVTSPWKRPNAARLMLTALSMSSMPSRMPTALRRVSTPNRPIANTRAPSVRYAEIGIGRSVFGAGQVEGAEQRGHEQDREQLEGPGESAGQRVADGDG